MNADKLSDRLNAVANNIPNGARLADIGSDHAYLPCYMVNKGMIPMAIAGEIAEGPFQSALEQVQEESLTNLITVRKGDGLEVIAPGEVDCITIAGMGGSLISSILEKGKSKLVGVRRLVLQPNVASFAVRRWLIDNGWELLNEEILKEDRKIYEILVAEKGEPLKPYKGIDLESGMQFGPILLREKSDVFMEKWKAERRNWQRILIQLDGATQNEETEIKKKELKKKLKMAEEAFQ
ncbi:MULTISPECIES: tRNA (adenine(22)-N(1))-methyltransferase [Mesobacillus]|uniref:SAM-dependent methyltransferase n=2 Tax=Mesobacillus TaxID=2675231 RepID=A0A0D6ZDP0_9BACI|nr:MULTISPECIES: class I SAM-dependent methyltransferase [Mesobacillus]KIY22703.1 SAM-dependent methyltransferase [Mesobacillus subterraneus]MDQ0414475.1 tRNA (adenine22-N1)-methyltransferase [Mesobacillus stamsii]